MRGEEGGRRKEEMRIKHLVIVRLLSRQMSVSGILDDKMIDYRLNLITSNLIPSLNNQTCLDFEFVVLVNPKLSQTQRNHIEDTIMDAHPMYLFTFLPDNGQYVDYVKNLWRQYDILVLSRIDDDDFVRKNVVRQAREISKLNLFNAAVCGYNHGYMYLNGKGSVVPVKF